MNNTANYSNMRKPTDIDEATVNPVKRDLEKLTQKELWFDGKWDFWMRLTICGIKIGTNFG